ncbi:MAG: site-specific integrase [Elusimicrobia bacterium]|nr:site-specific integrase [Elusimicrobiota bacterium]
MQRSIKAIVSTAVYTGLRRGELSRMKKEDINLDSCAILVPIGKNGEPGTVPITENLFKVLGPVIKSLPNPDSLVLDFSNYQKLWHRARKEAGLEGFRFHDLRHTFASHLAMANGDLMAVQGLLRLKTPSLVMRYSHLAPGYLRKAALTLDKQLSLETTEKSPIELNPIVNPITAHVNV